MQSVIVAVVVIVLLVVAMLFMRGKKPSAPISAPEVSPVSRYALMDKETGLYNKSFFVKKIEEELAKCASFKVSLTLALLNLPEGYSNSPEKESALRKIATVMTRDVRFSDVVSRFGDEQLGILYPMTNRSGAEIPTSRLETKINELLVQSEINGEANFTLLSYPENAESLGKLVQDLKT